jgi:hypothetical protein
VLKWNLDGFSSPVQVSVVFDAFDCDLNSVFSFKFVRTLFSFIHGTWFISQIDGLHIVQNRTFGMCSRQGTPYLAGCPLASTIHLHPTANNSSNFQGQVTCYPVTQNHQGGKSKLEQAVPWTELCRAGVRKGMPQRGRGPRTGASGLALLRRRGRQAMPACRVENRHRRRDNDRAAGDDVQQQCKRRRQHFHSRDDHWHRLIPHAAEEQELYLAVQLSD